MLLPLLQEPITRDTARELAESELRKPIYDVGDESLVRRFVSWLLEKFAEAFDQAVRITPGGLPALVLVIIAIVAIAIAARLGLGPTGFRDALTDRRRGARSTTAEEYRAEAERLAAAGEYKAAVRERFRAIIRELEQRAVLDQRAGRTAGEIAREGGAGVPAIRADLHAVAATFDLVWYGPRIADASDYAVVRDADDRIRSGKLTLATVS